MTSLIMSNWAQLFSYTAFALDPSERVIILEVSVYCHSHKKEMSKYGIRPNILTVRLDF